MRVSKKAMIGGFVALLLSAGSAFAQRTQAVTVDTLLGNAPGMTDGCNGLNPGCNTPTKGHKSSVKGDILKGALVHAAASCFVGVASNGEAQLTLVGSLALNTFAAEGCFQLFERLKKVSVVSGMHDLEKYCDRSKGMPGLKENNTDYYGLRGTVMVAAQVAEGDLAQFTKDAKAAGVIVLDAGNAGGTTDAGFKNIYLKMKVQTDAVFTPEEAQELENMMVGDMEARGVKMVPHKVSTMRTVYSFNGVTNATYDDGRKIEGTRALDVKTPMAALSGFGNTLGSMLNGVILKAEATFGKKCVVFDPKSGIRYTPRASAKDAGGGACYGTVKLNDGTTVRLNGKYVPDFLSARS